MKTTSTIMALHLRYRIWIAELNHDINLLRIFDDCLREIEIKDISATTRNEVEKYKAHFIDLRKEIDELRHIMHLHKMQLAADSKDGIPSIEGNTQVKPHTDAEKHYENFQRLFNQIKEDFVAFEEAASQNGK